MGEQDTVDYDTDVQPLPAPITEGMDFSLNHPLNERNDSDSTECLLPGDECTEYDQCCDSQCLYDNNGITTGICCVKESAFGCVSNSDCCSDSTECHNGFCLKSDGSRRRMADEELKTELHGVAFPMIMAAVSMIVILIAICIWFVDRTRSKVEGIDSLQTMSCNL